MDDLDRSEGVGDPSAGSNEAPRRHFYRVIWRWHFYAGLFVIPFMMMLAVTGIIYLFKPQLDVMMYRRLLFVTPQQTPLSAETQLASAQDAYSGANLTAFTPGEAPDRSSQITLTT